MSTWHTSSRSTPAGGGSRRRTGSFVAAVTLAVLATAVVPAGTAGAEATDPGPAVTLPFSNRTWPFAPGAAGPAELNSLVARTCNNGAPLVDQQWFTLPSAGSGLILARALRLVGYGHTRTPQRSPVGVAVVDHVTGRVLSCGEDPVPVADGQRRSLVGWSDAETLEKCAAADQCDLFPLEVFANWTTGRPSNDHWQDATVIDALPYHTTADTALADDDLPEQGGLCSRLPDDASTVWWRFTPPVSGALSLDATSETFGASDDEPVFHPRVSIGRLDTSGPRPVVEPDCGHTPFAEVEAGRTYLIWLHDSYETSGEPVLLRVIYGAKGTLSVSALRPTPPQDVSVIEGDRTIVLTWSPPASAGSGPITGYEVAQVNWAGGVVWHSTLPANARSQTVTELTNNGSTTFRITALNAAGPGNPVEVRATPTDGIRRPDRPTGVEFVTDENARRMTVTWSPPASSGSGPVTGYRLTRSGVDRSGAGPLSVLLPADARKYVLTDLKTYTPYTITLRAVNAYGDGPPVETATTLHPLTPSEPREVTAVAGVRSALVTWQPPDDVGWGGYLLGYRIRRYANGSATPELTVRVDDADTSLQVGGLTPGVAYRFDVTAINEVGTGEPSPRTEPVTPSASPTPPSVPTSVDAAQGKALSTAVLSWAPPLLDSGAPVTGYRVSRDGRDTHGTEAWATTLPADTRSFTFAHLRAWDTYTLSVQAINRAGTGPAGTRTVTIVDPRPSAPASVRARPGDASVTLDWEPPLHLAGSVTGYRIRRYGVSGNTVQSTVTVAASARSVTLTGLVNGTPYRFDVAAINAAGAGVPSDRTAPLVPVTVPGVPVIGTATGGDPGGPVTATATWEAPSSTGGTPILGYRVTAFRVGPGGDVVGSTVSALQPAGARSLELVLPHSTTYQFVVQAVNAVGIGRASLRSTVVIAR